MRSNAYDQMKTRLQELAKTKKTPLLGHFELTSRCNLNCKMCYVHNLDHDAALKSELTTEQWKQIFDEAIACEMLYASLSGGECMFRKDFKELYLHLFNKKIFITVLTNGTLITDEYVEFFKTYKPEKIHISLYGSDEDGYLRITGRKAFEKAISAITKLEEAGIDVRISITPNKYMKDDYINIVRLCNERSLFISNSEIALLKNRYDSEKDDYFLTDDEVFALQKARAELSGPLTPVEDTPEPGGSMATPPIKGLTCNAGNCLALVTADGKMYTCISVMLGGADVLKLGYAEAWKQTVQAASEVVYGAECVDCPYDKTCPKCPAFRLQDYYSGHCNPSVCEMTRRLVAAGVKKLVK